MQAWLAAVVISAVLAVEGGVGAETGGLLEHSSSKPAQAK